LFVGDDIPRYVILSHTWREEEILYEEVRNGKAELMKTAKKGLRKVLDSCKRADGDGYEYIWMDLRRDGYQWERSEATHLGGMRSLHVTHKKLLSGDGDDHSSSARLAQHIDPHELGVSPPDPSAGGPRLLSDGDI
jgi:hypothetical protein